MTCNYNHVAFLVADIDAAISKFSRIFGVEFNRPTVRTSDMLCNGERVVEEVTVSYSRTEPYIELIQGTETGYFALTQGEGFHHIGGWTSPAGCSLWQERYGDLGAEMQLMTDGEATTTLTDPERCHGVRVELVDERKRAGIEAWIATGTIQA